MASPDGISRGIGLNTIFVVRPRESSFIGMISGPNVMSDIILNSNNGESKTFFLNADLKTSKESSGISWKSMDTLSLVRPTPEQWKCCCRMVSDLIMLSTYRCKAYSSFCKRMLSVFSPCPFLEEPEWQEQNSINDIKSKYFIVIFHWVNITSPYQVISDTTRMKLFQTPHRLLLWHLYRMFYKFGISPDDWVFQKHGV